VVLKEKLEKLALLEDLRDHLVLVDQKVKLE
jgi:hypothetical protein